jgi:hypothetical protein
MQGLSEVLRLDAVAALEESGFVLCRLHVASRPVAGFRLALRPPFRSAILVRGGGDSVKGGSVWRRTLNVVDNHSVYCFRAQYKFQSKLFLQGRRQDDAIVRRNRPRRRVGPRCAKGFG